MILVFAGHVGEVDCLSDLGGQDKNGLVEVGSGQGKLVLDVARLLGLVMPNFSGEGLLGMGGLLSM